MRDIWAQEVFALGHVEALMLAMVCSLLNFPSSFAKNNGFITKIRLLIGL